MRRRVGLAAAVIATGAVATVFFWPVAATACTCLSRDRAALIEAADVVFVGRAVGLRVDPGARSPTVRGTFDIASVYKGSVGSRVVVRTATDAAACGAPFSTGRRYAVFAGRKAAALVTDICRGTTQDLAVLDGLTPISSANEPAPNPQPGSRVVPIVIAVLLVALVAVARRIWSTGPRPFV